MLSVLKYKSPGQFIYRRFWFVTSWEQKGDGSVVALNRFGRKLYLPAGDWCLEG